MELQFKSGYPNEREQVVIQYRLKESKDTDPPFEIGSAYFYKGRWWTNFHNPYEFSEHYDVLAWSEYGWKEGGEPIYAPRHNGDPQLSYPFEFDTLLLTDGVLDTLGFSDYWAGAGDYGHRSLDMGGEVGDKRKEGEYPTYKIWVIDEIDDPEAGYGYSPPRYCSKHICTKDWQTITFLHEMYEDILSRRTPEEFQAFVELTKKDGVNMWPYLEAWEEFKEKNNSPA